MSRSDPEARPRAGFGQSLSRRRVLKGAAALGVGAPIAAALDASRSVSAQATGVPVVILEGEPNNLNPIISSSRVTFTVLDQVNGFLARYDKDFNVSPALATSWEAVDDKTVRFHLRTGVKFHNGDEMTADDVKFSIEAHLDPAQGSGIRARLAAVDHVDADDPATATVHLKEPYAPLLDVLIDRVPILPKSVYATPNAAQDAPVGCGPFKFDEWSKNSYIQLSKFADHWEAGSPKTDGLKFLFLPDYNAAKSSLLSKQSDVLLYLNPADIPSLAQESDLVVSATPLLGFWWVGVSAQNATVKDKKIGQAIKLLLKRQDFIDYALAGHGAPAVVPIPKNSPFYSPELEYAADTDQAKAMFAAAGNPKLKLTVPNTPEEGPMGVVLQSQLKGIGIDVELETLDVPAFIERIFTNKDFEIMIVGDTAGPDPASLLNSYYLSDSPTNVQGYNNPNVDTLLKQATAVTDVAQRKDLYKQALAIALDDSPMVWIAQGERSSGYWDYLDGFVNLPTLRYELWKLTFTRAK
jgi:peptide/nickel transport system substrate-binding protein